MAQIRSQLNPKSAAFEANAKAMKALVDDLRVKVDQAAEGGGQAARDKHNCTWQVIAPRSDSNVD